jgi:hypothetical protein
VIVPFSLERRATDAPPLPVYAVLLPESMADGAAVIRVWTATGRTAEPTAYATAAGTLLVLSGEGRPPAVAEVPPGTVRLRRIWPDLYIPADGDLTPALLEDEAADLVRGRGLVFLPPDRVLEFRPASPLPVSALVAGPAVVRRGWSAFPEPPPPPPPLPPPASGSEGDAALAELFGGKAVPPSLASLSASLASAGKGVAERPPAPPEPSAGLLGRAGAAAAFGVGRALVWLGSLPGMSSVGRAGAGMVARAVQAMPSLASAFLEKQELALRELLRRFREGDVEEALKRAIPMGGADRPDAPTGPAEVYTGTELPRQDPGWSLRKALGGEWVPASIWYGGYDVQAELAKEYRRAADAAAAAGDFRRAAYIAGRLLRDWHAAANFLHRGGLFRDAAAVRLEVLKDKRGAAVEFAEAGDTAVAVALYRELGDHVAAGDLLARTGDPDAAEREYIAAAELLAVQGRRLAAARLLRGKAGRADLADAQLRAGWALRPAGESVPCGLELIGLMRESGDGPGLLAFATEAADAPDSDLFNALAETADSAAFPEDRRGAFREELRDAALLGIAEVLRRCADRDGNGSRGADASAVMGGCRAWSAGQVADAARALAGPRPPARTQGWRSVEWKAHTLGAGTVTAAIRASESHDVFALFSDGRIVCRGRGGDRFPVRGARGDGTPVVGMAASAGGWDVLVAARGSETVGGRWESYLRNSDGSFRQAAEFAGPARGLPPLSPTLAAVGHARCFLVAEPAESAEPAGPDVGWVGTAYIDAPASGPRRVLVVDSCTWSTVAEFVASGRCVAVALGGPAAGPTLLWDEEGVRTLDGRWKERPGRVAAPWDPEPDGPAMSVLPLSPTEAELAGVSRGRFAWAGLEVSAERVRFAVSRFHVADRPFRAAASISRRIAAGVTDDTLHVFEAGRDGLKTILCAPLPAPGPVALFGTAGSVEGELCLVTADGRMFTGRIH